MADSFAGPDFQALGLEMWGGNLSQTNSFLSVTGITYPALMGAAAAGIGSSYACTYDIFFVVGGDGLITFRRSGWNLALTTAAITAALADLTTDAGTPARDGFRLQPAYPNPFNPEHEPGLPDRRRRRTGACGCGSWTCTAASLRTLVDERRDGAREHAAVWDGRDARRPHAGQRQLPRRTHGRRAKPVPVRHPVEVGDGMQTATKDPDRRSVGIVVLIALAATSRYAGAAAAAERRSRPRPRLLARNRDRRPHATWARFLKRGPVILDFWATWCGPCRQALPELQQLHERYAARGLTVLSISTDEPRNRPKIGATARALGLTFPILIDTEKRTSQLYRVEAIPMTLLIDRDGRIRSLHRGYRPGDIDAARAGTAAPARAGRRRGRMTPSVRGSLTGGWLLRRRCFCRRRRAPPTPGPVRSRHRICCSGRRVGIPCTEAVLLDRRLRPVRPGVYA